MHLWGPTEAIIPEMIADSEQFGLQLLAPGHCTGWRAINAMEHAFKDRVVPLAVWKSFIVDGYFNWPDSYLPRTGGQRCDLKPTNSR